MSTAFMSSTAGETEAPPDVHQGLQAALCKTGDQPSHLVEGLDHWLLDCVRTANDVPIFHIVDVFQRLESKLYFSVGWRPEGQIKRKGVKRAGAEHGLFRINGPRIFFDHPISFQNHDPQNGKARN